MAAVSRSGKKTKRVPYYQQVANILRSHIVNIGGDAPVRLPGEEELAHTYETARSTIRQAMQLLVGEGLVQRARSRGTMTIPAGIRTWRRMRKSRVVTVVASWVRLPEAPSRFYGQVYQGILARSEQEGYHVIFRPMSGSYPEVGPRYVPEDPEKVVGVITVSIFDERLISMHVEAGYPVVCTDYWPVNRGADAVLFDCYGEGQQAVRFLLAQGHSKVFYLGNNLVDEKGRQHHESDADLMAAGCRRGLEEAGLSLPASYVRYTARRPAEIASAAEWFVSLNPRPTAGLVFERTMLHEFVNRLKEHGVECPRDVSLICKAQVSDPADCASLYNDPFRMGWLAVGLLLNRAAGRLEAGMRWVMASTLRRGPTVRHL